MSKHYYKLDADGHIGATSSVAYDFMAGEAVFDYPEDFDFGKQGDYKIADDSLVYDPLPAPEAQPSEAERIAELEEALALLLAGVTE